RFSDGATGTVASSTPHEPKSKVQVVNGTEFDFGTMERLTKRSHDFQFRNDGDAPLTLTVGETTCKCTIGALEKSNVAPGETVAVTLEWKAESLSRQFGQQAEIHTNDPMRPIVTLRIRGLVNRTIMAEPAEYHFGEVRAGESASLTTRLLSYRDADLKVESAKLAEPKWADHIKIETKPVELTAADEEEFPGVKAAIDITTTIESGLPLGPINQTIRVQTNLEGAEPLEIPLHARVVSEVSLIGPSEFVADRNSLVFGVIKEGVGAEAKLHVVVKGEQREQIQVELGEVDPDSALKVVLGEPVVSDKVVLYPLTVTIPADTTPVNRLGSEQAKAGRVLIKTTHPLAKEILLYVAFAVEG
ncbi:MAG: DUF1573 domain-containing protein, partial [Planctomycetales bacterium]|nr:DUF1573 domain-containing protein [Planctomycetales bacterium]